MQIRFVILISAIAITFMVAGCQKAPATPASTALPPPVSTVPPPSIVSFEAAPSEIASGQASILTWKVSGATRVEISQNVGTVSQAGSVTVKPLERTVYTLTASNSGGSVSRNVEVNVTQNLAAKPIALSLEEMEALGYVFNMNSEPTMQHAISTYYVMFLRSRGSELYIDNTVYVFNTVSEAEKVFAEDKNSNKMYVAGYETIGTQGYYLEVKGNPPTPSIYSIYFQKNNVYVRVRSNLPLSEIEAFTRILEKRVH